MYTFNCMAKHFEKPFIEQHKNHIDKRDFKMFGIE
jgi:hypothetical protein